MPQVWILGQARLRSGRGPGGPDLFSFMSTRLLVDVCGARCNLLENLLSESAREHRVCHLDHPARILSKDGVRKEV